MRAVQTLASAVALTAAAGCALAATPHVRASLVSQSDSIRPGAPLVVAIRLQMDPGWHTYWKNPGDAGLPTRVVWRLPAGVEAGPIQWPQPDRFGSGPVMSYGYAGEVLLPVQLSVSPALPRSGRVELAGRVTWLECREMCLPGKAELSLALPVTAATPRPSEWAAGIAAAQQLVPASSGAWDVAARRTGGTLSLAFRAPGSTIPSAAYFYAADPQVIDYAAPQPLRGAGRRQLLELRRDPNGKAPLERLRGVLVAELSGRSVALEIDAPLTSKEEGTK